MTGNDKPGAPLPFGPVPVEVIVASAGDVSASDGCQISLSGDFVVFQVVLPGGEAEMRLSIEDLLDAIGKYNRQVES